MTQTTDSPHQKQTREGQDRGLMCPRCECRHFRVLYTRAASGERLLRRRECRHCGRRMTTYEASATASL